MSLLALPKELLLLIAFNVTNHAKNPQLIPTALFTFASMCRSIRDLLTNDRSLWKKVFAERFDTAAIHRRRLDVDLDWRLLFKRRSQQMNHCKAWRTHHSLTAIDFEVLWEIISEHDECNIQLLLQHDIQWIILAGYQHGLITRNSKYLMCLPMLSVLVNYDFSLASHLCENVFIFTHCKNVEITSHRPIVSDNLFYHAFRFTTNLRLVSNLVHFQILSEDETRDTRLILHSPARHAIFSALHLFFISLFANHPNLRTMLPDFTPIPLHSITSRHMDIEFLRRYQRILRRAADPEMSAGRRYRLRNTSKDNVETQQNIYDNPVTMTQYALTGFGRLDIYISEAHLIKGDWLGYYSYSFPEDENTMQQPRLDGPSRVSFSIVYDGLGSPASDDEELSEQDFPSSHLTALPITHFAGDGVDALGTFTVRGWIDDGQDGLITFVKTYPGHGGPEEWEYQGRFLWGMGMVGKWGDDSFGGPWWLWKVER